MATATMEIPAVSDTPDTPTPPKGKKEKRKGDTILAEIKAANFLQVGVRIEGTAPYVQCKFSEKTRHKLMADMAATKAEKKAAKAERPPRDYDDDFLQAQHLAVGDWNGIPTNAFIAAMIAACRTVGLVMTQTKTVGLKVIPDGFDRDDGTALVRIIAGPPERSVMHVRNDNGSIDIRIRPMWRTWAANLTIEFDADMITPQSVINLLDRAGRQIGIGEGRPFSRNSVGMGWGTFRVVMEDK